MDSLALARPIPFTVERAQTELILTRRHVQAAQESLALALRIVGRLDGDRPPAAQSELKAVMTRLEEIEATLRGAPGE